MSESTKAKARPMSPFMIGPYYKPQLTSMTSITHRLTGLFLVLGSLGLLLWLTALAAGPERFAAFQSWMDQPIGRLLALGFLWAACYHLLNGIRHLVWDAGKALDIKTAYAFGWFVIVGSVVLAAVIWMLGGAA